MVRATVILSVVAAFVAVVSAAPKGSLIDVDGGEYIGTGNINAQGALTRVVNADNLAVHGMYSSYTQFNLLLLIKCLNALKISFKTLMSPMMIWIWEAPWEALCP